MSKHFDPRPYQRSVIEHVFEHQRPGVWAGMGMGKTSSTLVALDGLSLVDARPTLVLAPLRVAQSTWPDEAAKWAQTSHMEVQPIIGDAGTRARALRNPNAGVFTINYENIPWLVEALGDKWPFATIVADESTKLKSFRLQQGGKRTKALASVAHKKVDRFIELTGTPSPNGLIDLWGQAWFLDAGKRLGRSFSAFTHRWFQQSFDGFSQTPLPHAQAEIEEALRDICLSLEARDYFDLREPVKNIVRVELPAKARALYREMEKTMFAEIDGSEVEAFNAAARTNKCLQLANGAAYTDDEGNWKEVHDAKIQALQSIIEEAAGAPVLVAYHFKSDLARLQRAFPYGRTLDADPDTIRQWNAGAIRLLFAHPASAGHGLNLQDGGNILAFFGLNWNLEEHQQIIERIGPTRQMQAGHDRPVFIHYITAADTVDETVLERLETKREVQDLLLEAMKRKGLG
ncbi:DEAD/DEAH box helicase [Asticcacaulis sp.]|uniref:DEAD/DEAH box helicase n=1 Tax=Asticcacaulis sp. TaxID=1872648 RepID=UPI0031DCFC89